VLPRPLSRIMGPTSTGRGGEGMEGDGDGRRKGEKEMGRDRGGRGGKMRWCWVTLERSAPGDIYPSYATAQTVLHYKCIVVYSY